MKNFERSPYPGLLARIGSAMLIGFTVVIFAGALYLIVSSWMSAANHQTSNEETQTCQDNTER